MFLAFIHFHSQSNVNVELRLYIYIYIYNLFNLKLNSIIYFYLLSI